MREFTAFNPSAMSGIVKTNGINKDEQLVIYNDSIYRLRFHFNNGDVGVIPALWNKDYIIVNVAMGDIKWEVIDSLNIPNNPSNIVYGEIYEPGEHVASVNSSMQRSVVSSIPGGVSVSSSSSVFYRVKDSGYGAVGDGITDDSTAIANCRLACNNAGGGIVFYDAGTFITGNLIDYDNVTDMGSGITATTLKLKAGSNTDLFGSRFVGNINLSSAIGSGSSSASKKWHIRDMTLDGNRANQSAGPSYVIRVYAYGYKLTNVLITGGYSGGIQRDYNGAFPSSDWVMETQWVNVYATLNNGIGVQAGGPTDSQWLNGFVNSSVSHNIHMTPHSSGYLHTNVHAYTNSPQPNANACAWLIEAGGSCVNCIAETSGAVQVAIVTSNIFRWIGGSIFAGSYAGTGIQIGQAAGNTPFLGQINQSAGVTVALSAAQYYISGIMLQNISNVNGFIQFVSDGGGYINYIAYKPAGSPAVFTGTKSSRTTIDAIVVGSTLNGTIENDGGLQLASGLYNQPTGDKHSFRVNDVEQMSIDTGSVRAQVPFKGPNSGVMVIDSANANIISLRYNGVEQAEVVSNGLALKNGSLSMITGGFARMGKGFVSGVTATVNHGLGVTPDIVIITPDIAQPGSATVGVGNLNATTFDAHIGAGTGFYWLAMQG